ncbi:MarR family winged helix-turn-helix transcriptional regulator [Bounagaea algeriensis]
MAHAELDRLPTHDEVLAYRSFLRAYARVTRCLENDLIDEQKLSLAAFEVLEALVDAPGQRLRMTELADAVLLSRSGVTRLVDRLERLGLVDRVRVRSDGRGVQAVITEQGEQRLRDAVSIHRAGIADYFVRAATGDLDALHRICLRLSEGGVPAPPGNRAQA